MSISETIKQAIQLLNAAINVNNGNGFGDHTSREAHEAAALVLKEARKEIQKHQFSESSPLVKDGTFWKVYNKIDDAYQAVAKGMVWGYSEIEPTVRSLEAVLVKTYY